MLYIITLCIITLYIIALYIIVLYIIMLYIHIYYYLSIINTLYFIITLCILLISDTKVWCMLGDVARFDAC